MRFLGIDYGRARCGIAISDESGHLAVPVETVSTCEIFNYLEEFCQNEGIRTLVLGNPLNRQGMSSPMSLEVEEFKKNLEKYGFVVILVNEYKTSQNAYSLLRGQGLKQKNGKKFKDEMAATLILQDYLDFYLKR